MIYIAGDHHCETALSIIQNFLEASGRDYIEYGYTDGARPDAKLQEFIPMVVNKVKEADNATGILVCGTGAGVEIGANRFSGIRASLCYSPKAAEWARVYDKANVLCVAGWALQDIDLEAILDSWFNSSYDGSIKRLEMFEIFDSWANSDCT